MKGEVAEALAAAQGVEKWLASAGVPQKLADEGFSEADLDHLVELTFTTPSLGGLLGLAPTAGDKEAVRRIYADSINPLN